MNLAAANVIERAATSLRRVLEQVRRLVGRAAERDVLQELLGGPVRRQAQLAGGAAKAPGRSYLESAEVITTGAAERLAPSRAAPAELALTTPRTAPRRAAEERA